MSEEIVQTPPEVITEGENNVTEQSNENTQQDQISSPSNYEEAFSMAMEKDLNKTLQGNKQVESSTSRTETNESTDTDNQSSDNNSESNSVSEKSDRHNNNTRETEPANVGESFEQFGQRATTYIKEQADREARQEVDKIVKEANLVELNIDLLQVTDKEAGKVYWNNPLDVNNPFTDLTSVRNFVREWNDEIKSRKDKIYKDEFESSKNKWIKKFEPSVRLKQFEERYNKMPKDEKAIFLNQIKDNAVLNEKGKVVGFDCDLNAIADIVHENIKIYKKQNNISNEKDEPVSTPPVDTPSSMSVNNKESDGENVKPHNATEAFNIAMMKALNNRNENKQGGK